MKLGYSTIFAAMILMGAGGCTLTTPVDDTIFGRKIDSLISISTTSYDYTGYDASGNEVVKGTMILIMKDSSTVEGSWDFEATGSTTNIGPQVGKGTLKGSARGDTLFLNLNPGFADNNVILSGVLHGGDFSGTWSWVGFAGIITQGTFHASLPINGTWVWVKSAGGIWYHEIFPPPSQTIVFGTDSSFTLFQNDSLVAATTYTVRYGQIFYSPTPLNVIRYGDSNRFMPQTYEIDADTLILSDLCTDCFAHTYVRKH